MEFVSPLGSVFNIESYQNYLDRERRCNVAARQEEKRKAALQELQELKAKRRVTESSVDVMVKSADQFAEEAEKSGRLSLLTKSNGMRRATKEKSLELQ